MGMEFVLEETMVQMGKVSNPTFYARYRKDKSR